MQFDKGHSQRHSAGFGVMGLKWGLVLLTLVILTGVCAVTAHAALPYISKIDVRDMGDAVQITALSSSAIQVQTGRLGDRYIVVDLQGRLATREQKRVVFNAAGIRAVRSACFKDTPTTARIAIGTTAMLDYSVKTYSDNRRTVVLVRKQGVATAKAQMPSVVAKPAPSRSERPLGDGEAQIAAKPQKLVSLDFVGSDIHDVLKALAIQGGVNIVASPDVKGNVTVSLTKVTVDEALKLVTNISGFKYQFVDGSYVVGTADNVKNMTVGAMTPEEKGTEVVIISYADPVMIMKMLEEQYADVNISSNVGKESKVPAVLILSGPKSSIEAAKALADGIEKSVSDSSQDLTTEVYEVKYADIAELAALMTAAVPGLRVTIGPAQGFNMQAPTAVALGSGDMAAPVTAGDLKNAPSKMLLLQGSTAGVEKAKALLAKLDTPVPQILIEARVVDISDTSADQLGISWGDSVTGLSSTTFAEPWAVGADGAILKDNPHAAVNNSLSIGRFIRSPLAIQASIKGLIESGKGKVLANPNVLALDGKPASAFVGDEVKYVIKVDQALNGGTTVTTETARVGVQLHTVSRISSDGYITMNLHPEVSVITKWMDTPAKITLPQISRRYIDSTVRVKDGETIVIGGLIKDDELKSMSGVPFLKDLPFIGQLFKSRSTTKTHSEVMMFITPRVLVDK